MVNREELPGIKGIRYIRILVDALEQWVRDNTYTSGRVEFGVQEGATSCLNVRRRKVSTVGRTAPIGRLPTPTEAVSVFNAVLGQPARGRP